MVNQIHLDGVELHDPLDLLDLHNTHNSIYPFPKPNAYTIYRIEAILMLDIWVL
jgi:hypothetical protein